jgi:UMF1 family MFS transporter
MQQTVQINHPPTIRGWAMFDWANSVYNLVITSTIFPAYYTAITTSESRGDRVQFFGFEVVNTVLSNYALAFAYLVMALTLPILSSIADYTKRKMRYMKFFTIMGSLACMGLFFFKIETLEWGIFCFVLAAMGYIGGVLFNNSYLPQIASVDQQDRVSALGFAYGYVGCVTLQILCFVLILKPDWFGIQDASLAPRISFLLVGIWWLGFSQISFRQLPADPITQNKVSQKIVKQGFKELIEVARVVRQIPTIKRFLPAFFCYSVGVQTVLVVAAAFGEKVLNLGAAKLIGTILIIQLVAILGAMGMSRLAKIIGNTKVLMIVVSIWIGICVSAFYLNNENQFYLLAALVGLVMGGIQSISRSTYSKLLPEKDASNPAFFSFYDVTERLAIVLGLFSFALIEQITDNIRFSTLSLSIFFVIGLILLFIMQRSERKIDTTLPYVKSIE